MTRRSSEWAALSSYWAYSYARPLPSGFALCPNRFYGGICHDAYLGVTINLMTLYGFIIVLHFSDCYRYRRAYPRLSAPAAQT